MTSFSLYQVDVILQLKRCNMTSFTMTANRWPFCVGVILQHKRCHTTSSKWCNITSLSSLLVDVISQMPYDVFAYYGGQKV